MIMTHDRRRRDGDAMATRWRRDDDARLVSFKRGLTIDKMPSFSRFLSLAQLSYGVQTRFLGKPMGKLYWKEGERNKHDGAIQLVRYRPARQQRYLNHDRARR